MEEMQSFYTFKEGRKCLKCKIPIPDQVHKSRKYCVTKRLPDGTVASCKDDYHSPIRKLKNEPFEQMAKHHKLMYVQIEKLLKAKGENVSRELLNIWGIILRQPFQFDVENGKFIFYYHKYLIKDLGNNHYKIEKHGLF
jgi:hypothetical protein